MDTTYDYKENYYALFLTAVKGLSPTTAIRKMFGTSYLSQVSCRRRNVERDEEICELKRQGYSNGEIADAMGVSKVVASQVLMRNGMTHKHGTVSEHHQRILDLHKQGLKPREIALIVGIKATAVSEIVVRERRKVL